MTDQMTSHTPTPQAAQTSLSQAGLLQRGQPTARQMKLIMVALAVLASAVVGLSIKVFFYAKRPPQLAFVDMDALISPQAQRIARQAMAGHSASRESQALQHVVYLIKAHMTKMAEEGNWIVFSKRSVLSGGIDKTEEMKARIQQTFKSEETQQREGENK